MRLHIALIVLLSIFLLSMAGAQEGQRPDFGGDGVFSYVPPDAWKVSEFPGLKYKIAFGEPNKGFAPNIVVVDESSEQPLDDYTKDNIATMQKFFNGLKILSQADFSTSEGARSIKLLTERNDDQSKKRLRQIYYFFDAGKKKLVVTCSSLAEDGAALDPVFDAAIKTFLVTSKPG